MKPGTLCRVVVLLAIGARYLSQPALGQGVEPEKPANAGDEAIKPSVSAYIEICSVIPESERKAAEEKPQQVLHYGLKYADYDRITQAIPAIRESVPIRELRKPIRSRQRILEGRIVGTTASYGNLNRLELDRGRFLSKADHETYQNYAVIGSEVARILYPEEDPINQSVKLGSDYFTIVGVVKERASSSVISGRFQTHDFNKDVYIPLNTCKLRFGERIVDVRAGAALRAEETQLSQLTLQLRDDANVEDTAALIRSTLKPAHPKGDVKVIVFRVHGKSR